MIMILLWELPSFFSRLSEKGMRAKMPHPVLRARAASGSLIIGDHYMRTH